VQVKRAAVIGCGTMGAGVTHVAAQHGYELTVVEAGPGAAEAALRRVEDSLQRTVSRGRLSQAEAAAALERVTMTTDLDAVADADLVIEAVFEDVALKCEVLGKVDRITAPDVMIASNTSTIPLVILAGATRRPAGIVTFAVIRLRSNPEREGRQSRFAGSHTGAAWLVLGMIFLVIATLLLYRGAQVNTGVFPYARGAFASQIAGHWLAPLGGVNSVLEAVFLLAQLAVVLGFLVFLAYSKHLHIITAPVNVLFSRRPDALRGLEPMRSNGTVLDFEEADPDTDVFGLGKIEDFTWKGLLDMATCTECGRCQSQCPAWATGKPLSPKQVILDLRDHALAKAPYLLAGSDEAREALPDAVKFEAGRPLVGGADEHGVIDPEALWACTNCGACVEECPVDIEHIDHIGGMRRHQVLIESAFPAEASGMLKNLENKGDPWGMGANRRLAWAEELGFDVPVAGGTLDPEVEYLFWVGCAGALEDRARKTTKAIATLLHSAGVAFAGAGPGGDLHRGPGAADGQRVRVLDAGRPEHRDPERDRSGQAREDDRRVVPALLQHDRERVPAAGREL
jgi:heterodisulfide reductase subunit C